MHRTRSISAAWRRGPAAIALTLALALSAGLVGGCVPDSHSESLPLLGTAVSITAYGDDQAALRAAVDAALGEIDAVALAADAYEVASPIARINRHPFVPHIPPAALHTVSSTVERLGVAQWFDVRMWGVSALYDFGDDGWVPDEAQIATALELARSASWSGTEVFRFAEPSTATPVGDPGIDLGGAAKGLAADMAALSLAGDPDVVGALIDAGSTSVAVGTKPDGTPWRIGIEDPREDGRIIAVIEADGPVAVSTSGDYQQFFERDGIRYHHILDPRTGRPADGVRSVTVACSEPLDADILSTALFVAGVDEAVAYARTHEIGLYLVDDEGRAHVVPGPEDSSFRFEEIEDPLP